MPDKIPMPGLPVRGSATGRPIMALFDLLGRTWAMGIVWQLAEGPTTFRGLQKRCDNMSASLLAKRLKELRATGLVHAGEAGYELTSIGLELAKLLQPMGSWSLRWASELAECDSTDEQHRDM